MQVRKPANELCSFTWFCLQRLTVECCALFSFEMMLYMSVEVSFSLNKAAVAGEIQTREYSSSVNERCQQICLAFRRATEQQTILNWTQELPFPAVY